MRAYLQPEIEDLISCPKGITEPPKRNMTLERRSYRNDFSVASADGERQFHVFIRQSEEFPENFSIGLEYLPHDGSGSIILLRCNGPHAAHVNFIDMPDHHYVHHVHVATTEAIASGLRSERDAQITADYGTFQDALGYFVRRCNIAGAEKYYKYISNDIAKQMELF
jgi:hypothetical protein